MKLILDPTLHTVEPTHHHLLQPMPTMSSAVILVRHYITGDLDNTLDSSALRNTFVAFLSDIYEFTDGCISKRKGYRMINFIQALYLLNKIYAIPPNSLTNNERIKSLLIDLLPIMKIIVRLGSDAPRRSCLVQSDSLYRLLSHCKDLSDNEALCPDVKISRPAYRFSYSIMAEYHDAWKDVYNGVLRIYRQTRED